MTKIKSAPIPKATYCEWPVEENSMGVTFCGCKQLHNGSSYCSTHYNMAYYTPEDSEDLDITGIDVDTVEIDPLEVE